MRRDEVIQILQQHRRELGERFGVRSLALFGSIARDEAGPESDVDVLVEFPGSPTFDQYMGLKLFLEDALGRKVDVATKRSIRERVRSFVEKEAVYVA